MAKVSVIIPTYNRADLIGYALQSVLDQVETDWECIIIDDGSTDNTRDVVATFLDRRIHYIFQENQKLPSARNSGISASTAEFITFLDSDDRFLPEKLSTQLKEFEKNPIIGMVLSGWADVDIQFKIIREVKPWLTHPNLELLDWLMSCPVPPPAVMVRKKWLDSVGGFDPEQHYVEDWDLWLRLSYAGCQMAWATDQVCLKTVHSQSMIRNVKGMNDGLFRLMEKFFSQPDLPDEINLQHDKVFANINVESAGRALGAGQVELARSYLLESIRLEPSLLKGYPPQVLQSLASGALTDIAPDVELYLKTWVDALEKFGYGLERNIRQLRGLIAATSAFEQLMNKNFIKARQQAMKALLADPTWFTNRGLIRILVSY